MLPQFVFCVTPRQSVAKVSVVHQLACNSRNDARSVFVGKIALYHSFCFSQELNSLPANLSEERERGVGERRYLCLCYDVSTSLRLSYNNERTFRNAFSTNRNFIKRRINFLT